MKKLDEIIAKTKGRQDVFPFIWALYNNNYISNKATYIDFLKEYGHKLAHLRAYERGDFQPPNFDWKKLDEANSPDTPKPPRVLKTNQPRQTPVDEDCRVLLSFSTNKIPNNCKPAKLTVEDLKKYKYAPPKGIFELRIGKDTFPTFLKESYRLVNDAPETWESACRIFNSRLLFLDIDFISQKQEDVKVFGNVGFIYNLIDEFKGFLSVGYDNQSQNPNPKHGYSYHLFAWVTGDEANLMESSMLSKDFTKSGVDIFQTKTSHLIHFKKGKKVFDGPLKKIDSEYVKELQNILVQKKQSKGKNFFKDGYGVLTRLKGEEEWSLFETKKFLPTNTISRLLKDNERFVKIETPVRSGKTTMTISTIEEFAKKPKEKEKKLLYIVKNKISRDEVYEGLLKFDIDFTRIVASGEQEGEKNTKSFEEFVKGSKEESILLMTHSMFGKNFTHFLKYVQNKNNILIIDEGHFGVQVDDSWSFLSSYKVQNLKNLASTFILSGNRTMNDSEDEEIVNSSFLRYRTNIELENQIKFNTFKCKSMNDFANYCLQDPKDSIDILLNYSKIDLFTAWDKTQNQYPNKKIGFCWSGDTAGIKMFPSIRYPIYLMYDFIYTTSIVAGFSLQFPGESKIDFEIRMKNKVVRIGIEGPSYMNQAFINDITQLIGRFQPHWGIKIEIFFVSRKGTNAFPENLLVPEVYTRFKSLETAVIDYKQTVKKEEPLVFEDNSDRAKTLFKVEYDKNRGAFEFFKTENEFDFSEPNVIDFGSVWSEENRAEIERLDGIKRNIRDKFKLYKKDTKKHGEAIRKMKESLTTQEKGLLCHALHEIRL